MFIIKTGLSEVLLFILTLYVHLPAYNIGLIAPLVSSNSSYFVLLLNTNQSISVVYRNDILSTYNVNMKSSTSLKPVLIINIDF
jgi:hypothetical protein